MLPQALDPKYNRTEAMSCDQSRAFDHRDPDSSFLSSDRLLGYCPAILDALNAHGFGPHK
jgi:hypothetical protein